MKNEILSLKNHEISLDTLNDNSPVQGIFEKYGNKVVRILVFSPFNHQMSLLSIGGLSIFHEINHHTDLPGTCDRAFFYDFLFNDSGSLKREYRDTPFLSFETCSSIMDFDVIAYGMTNPGWIGDLVKFSTLTKIPLFSKDRRGGNFPLFIGGGPGFANPIPYGEIFDACIIGRAEEPLKKIVESLYKLDPIIRHTRDVTKLIANIPNIYTDNLPILRSTNIVNNKENIKYKHTYSSRILGYNTGVIVVNRGCKFECSFCQLGSESFQPENYNDILEIVDEFLAKGMNTLILNSPTFTQFPNHDDLLNKIFEKVQEKGIIDFNLYIGSVRIDEIHPKYLESLKKFDNFNHTYLKYTGDKKDSFIAVAPDFGNNRLMKLMKKGLSKEKVLQGIKNCVQGGIHNFHLYFMVGIESETISDRLDIARMVKEIWEISGPNSELYLKINLYIPSANTKGQRMKMYSVKEYHAFLGDIESELSHLFTPVQKKNIHIIPLEEDVLVLEAILMRGGKNIRPILYDILHYKIDGKEINEKIARELCEIHGISYEALLERKPDDISLPWENFIDITNN